MAKIESIDIIHADVKSILQRVKYETEEVIINPSTELQVVMRSPEKYIEKVIANPVTEAIDINIQEENIKAGVEILGKQGTFTNDATATAKDLMQNRTAYVNGEKIIGSVSNNGALNYTPSTSKQTIPEGYTEGGTIEAITSDIIPNLRPEIIKKDETILGLKGTYAGEVKLFETEEKMQADPSANVGDFAVVYGEVTEKLTQTATFTKASFPDTVTLSAAMTTSFSAYLNGTNDRYRIILNKTSFKLTNYNTSEVIVEYTTTDATTYTKTSNVSSYDFGEEIQYSGTWRAYFAEFIFIHFNQYGGFFEYGGYLNTDYTQIPLLENVTYSSSRMRAIASGGYEYELSKISTTVQKLINDEGFSSYSATVGIDLFVSNGQLCVGFSSYTYNGTNQLSTCYFCFDDSYNFMDKICCGSYDLSATTNIKYQWYILDLENNTYTPQGVLPVYTTFTQVLSDVTRTIMVYEIPNAEVLPLKYKLDGTYALAPTVALLLNDITSWKTVSTALTDSLNPTHYKYLPKE